MTRIVYCLLLLNVFITAPLSRAAAQKWNISEVSMCGLLTPREIEEFTGKNVIRLDGNLQRCTWQLGSGGIASGEMVTALARYESELPNHFGMEDIVRFAHLGKAGGTGALYLGEIDRGVPGVHEACGFYMFSLNFALKDADLQRVGRELGKRALRRFNGAGEHCFLKNVLQDQFPGDW